MQTNAGFMDLIVKYFTQLTDKQYFQFESMFQLYAEWNSKINLISRKDMAHFYERHVLHSLAIARFAQFAPNTHFMDAGTGGGFPGIPLAILLPESGFTLVDSIGKKIKAVENITNALQLKNVTVRQARIEQIDRNFDFVVSRAVTRLPDFVKWTKGKISTQKSSNPSHGILYLKGGDLEPELSPLRSTKKIRVYELSQWFDEAFFETKKLVHISD